MTFPIKMSELFMFSPPHAGRSVQTLAGSSNSSIRVLHALFQMELSQFWLEKDMLYVTFTGFLH